MNLWNRLKNRGHLHLKKQVKRVLMSLCGVALCGVVVGIFNVINLGPDPFTVLVNGLGNLFGLTYGVTFLLVTGTMLLVTLLVDRHYIHLATIFNLLIIGPIADGVSNLLRLLWMPDTLPQRIIWFVAGIVVLCIASSLYFVAELGVSGYDAMALILKDKTPLPFRVCRISTDVFCVVIGFFLGAVVGVGTVITALFMGPVVQWFNVHLSIPLLYGKESMKSAQS